MRRLCTSVTRAEAGLIAGRMLEKSLSGFLGGLFRTYFKHVERAFRQGAVRNAELAQRVDKLSTKIDELRKDLPKAND